jgi:hypothetical protein
MKGFFANAAALAIALASPAGAATLITNGNGKLTGATGVTVYGTSYDVEFVEGTCLSLFGGCDNASDFNFGPEAEFAAQALFDQVFIDGPAGQFDTNPGQVFGCSGECSILIPWLTVDGVFTAAYAYNATLDAADLTGLVSQNLIDRYDTTSDRFAVFARFTPSAAAVPEPSTWAMMLLGFGAMGASLRYRRRTKLSQLA